MLNCQNVKCSKSQLGVAVQSYSLQLSFNSGLLSSNGFKTSPKQIHNADLKLSQSGFKISVGSFYGETFFEEAMLGNERTANAMAVIVLFWCLNECYNRYNDVC